MPFDDSVLEKKLEAETRAESEKSTKRVWVSDKLDDIKCKFSSTVETVKNVGGCIFCKK
jgi:hypothetical protein